MIPYCISTRRPTLEMLELFEEDGGNIEWADSEHDSEKGA
jgi:hypothetical protein